MHRPVDGIAIDALVAAAGVGKGSFFNHFADKDSFARAIADDIRRDVEARVTAFNAGVADPVERLAGGMVAAAAFARDEPKRTAVLARAARGMTGSDHPLNRGVLEDVRAGVAAGLLRAEAARSGVLFWLGCCQTVMSALVEQRSAADRPVGLLRDMLILGLAGLGAGEDAIARLVDAAGPLGRLPRPGGVERENG